MLLVAVLIVFTQAQTDPCSNALARVCSASAHLAPTSCEICVNRHQHELRAAGCSSATVQGWCDSIDGMQLVTHITGREPSTHYTVVARAALRNTILGALLRHADHRKKRIRSRRDGYLHPNGWSARRTLFLVAAPRRCTVAH